MNNINTMIDRAGEILDYLYNSDKPIGVSKISNDLQMPKATAFRILVTLEKWNIVEKQYNTDNYKLGKILIKYGAKVSSNLSLIGISKPIINALSERIGESVNLNIEYQGNSLNIYKSSNDNFTLVSKLTPISPLNCSSSGKVFLSAKSEEELKKYFSSENCSKRTMYSLTTYEGFTKELDSIKANGLAYDNEEYEYGLFCIAAPIYHEDGVIAAISVSGPKTRLEYKGLEMIEKELKLSCDMLSDLVQYLDTDSLL
ncbi:IclR family transcriptional regulator [Sporosalibacterium faouarense]|uniref:IclR family transcriptional regulator n=1 Tax=Sporosalibacterium faouarense TaxID=516123 RepID=UPI00141D22A7|nr:IclR family transcriptional regulator [Sporosalibacterium faouarense]MTI46296.1 IclR family transcriptional regulator [Bacillota bacterium]